MTAAAMAMQKGLVVEEAGAPFKLVDTLPRPRPGPGQALVKTLFVAINPVELVMQKTVLLATSLPAVLGSDFSGVVVELGSGCTRLREGDYVYSSCNLGQNACSPFQETFVVDEASVFKKSGNVTVEECAGIGVGLLSAAFGIVVGAKTPLPDAHTAADPRDEWIVILGGSGTVGHYAIQIARACGFKVVASCSPAKASRVLASGANASFSNRDSPEAQAAKVKALTGDNFGVVFDTSAQADQAALSILEQSGAEAKFFTTTGSVSNYTVPAGVAEYQVSVGMLGRDSVIGRHITEETAKLIPVLERHVAAGTIRPVECELFDESGWGALIDGVRYYAEGKAAAKLVVRVQD